MGPLFDQGVARYETPELQLTVMKSSGTAAGLEVRSAATAKGRQPQGDGGYDFTPYDLLAARSVDGYFHLGDLNLRLRAAGETAWQGYSTAMERHPVIALPAQPGELERDSLAPTLPRDFPAGDAVLGCGGRQARAPFHAA
jgi:hypothetical protein